MQAFLKQHRWVILAAGAAIQVLTGVPAAWGVFQRGVCEGYSLSQENAAMIFSLTICFFGIGCILGGLLQDKKGPRTAGLAGAVRLAAGCCGIGVGGNLVNKSWIEAGEWDKITELAQAYRKAVDEA